MNPKDGEVTVHDAEGITPDNVTAESKEKQVPPQFLAREAIAKKREADRQSEMNGFKTDTMEDDGTITPHQEAGQLDEATPIEEQAPSEPAPEPITTNKPNEPSLETAPQPAMEEYRELNVMGQKVRVPLSKIIEEGQRAVQKESAADMKLAAASELERRLKAQLESHQPPDQGVETRQVAPSEDDAVLAKAIQFGTEEEARAAIAKLRTAGRGDEGSVRELVRVEIEKDRRLAEFKAADSWVRTEHKEIFQNPELSQLFMVKETMRRQAGDTTPTQTLYASIAQEIETQFQLKRAESIASPVIQDRVTRKMTSPRPVEGASGKQAAPAPRKAPTVTDFVQRQRELRGQAPLPSNRQGI